MRALWVIRILFLSLCTVGGYAVSQMRPELIEDPLRGTVIGFGLGGLLIAIDEMLKGFSLRAFSAATFGLVLGTVIAVIVDHSGLFEFSDDKQRWLIRLGLFLSFSYIGMVLAMRSNKEDFSLIIPYVRFASQSKPENLMVLDTSVIIDGRIADLIEANFLEGLLVVPRFVLRELQQIADSNDPVIRARGRRGLQTGAPGPRPGRQALYQRLQPRQSRRTPVRSPRQLERTGQRPQARHPPRRSLLPARRARGQRQRAGDRLPQRRHHGCRQQRPKHDWPASQH